MIIKQVLESLEILYNFFSRNSSLNQAKLTIKGIMTCAQNNNISLILQLYGQTMIL